MLASLEDGARLHPAPSPEILMAPATKDLKITHWDCEGQSSLSLAWALLCVWFFTPVCISLFDLAVFQLTTWNYLWQQNQQIKPNGKHVSLFLKAESLACSLCRQFSKMSSFWNDCAWGSKCSWNLRPYSEADCCWYHKITGHFGGAAFHRLLFRFKEALCTLTYLFVLSPTLLFS